MGSCLFSSLGVPFLCYTCFCELRVSCRKWRLGLPWESIVLLQGGSREAPWGRALLGPRGPPPSPECSSPLLKPDPWGGQSAVLASFHHHTWSGAAVSLMPPHLFPRPPKKESFQCNSHFWGSGREVYVGWDAMWLRAGTVACMIFFVLWSQCRSYSFCL